jgi:hypothetical protein
MHGVSRIRIWLPSLGTALLLLFPWPFLLQGQTASDRQVKAAYLYNFAKFVEWPEQAFANSTAAIRLCVLNDRLFEADVHQVVNGKVLGGRPIDVIGVQALEQLRSCHILFINLSDSREARRILEGLRGASVLTVAEMKGFVADGGIINFVLQDDRVQFEVNHRAANRVGLRISSRLLGVAKFVLE